LPLFQFRDSEIERNERCAVPEASLERDRSTDRSGSFGLDAPTASADARMNMHAEHRRADGCRVIGGPFHLGHTEHGVAGVNSLESS